MALIECKECGTQISDTAVSCPKCGAVVPKTMKEDEIQCPFCKTVIHEDATTCPGCGAVKGYMYESRYGAMGKVAVIIWSIIFPLFLTLVFFAWHISWLAIITLLWAAYGIYRVVTGPRWFQTKHPH